MKCNKFRRNIFNYIDDELTANNKADFEEHMNNCSACKEFLAQTKLACQAVKDIGEAEVPSDLKDMVMARIKSNYNDNAAVKKKVYMFRKFAAAVASVIIIVIASIIFSDVFNKGLLKSPANHMDAEDNGDYHKASQKTDVASETRVLYETPEATFKTESDHNATQPDESHPHPIATEAPSAESDIRKIKLIYNKKFLDINVESLINMPEIRDIKHSIQEKDGIVTISFEREYGGTGCDIYYLYNYLIDNFNPEVLQTYGEPEMDKDRTILVVN